MIIWLGKIYYNLGKVGQHMVSYFKLQTAEGILN